MEFNRLVKQLTKQTNILLGGLTPSAIHGRFIGPKVLANSVPKAGTNLLQELVLLLPLMRGQITPTLHLDNGAELLITKLSRIKEGQCASGHIAYDAAVDAFIHKSRIRHILIIRDFRDVIYSNIRYLEYGHKSHPHNRLFASLPTLDAKIQACLTGHGQLGIRAWPDLIRDYRGWLNSKDTLVVRYENLICPDSLVAETEIYKIITYLGLKPEIPLSEIRKKMINPKGLTFNAPGVEKWKTNFNQNQIAKLNQALGEELIFFGYECDWTGLGAKHQQ